MRNHVGVVGLVVADDARDVGAFAELDRDLVDAVFGGGGVNVAFEVHQRHHAGVDLAVGGGLEAVRGLDALGRRVGGAVRTQIARHRAAEHAGDHGAGNCDVQHGAPAGVEEAGEPTQHRLPAPGLGGRRPCPASAHARRRPRRPRRAGVRSARTIRRSSGAVRSRAPASAGGPSGICSAVCSSEHSWASVRSWASRIARILRMRCSGVPMSEKNSFSIPSSRTSKIGSGSGSSHSASAARPAPVSS